MVIAKEFENTIKWLKKAFNKKGTIKSISGINCREDRVEATNGIVYFAAKTSLHTEDEEKLLGLYSFDTYEKLDLNFPDIDALLDKLKKTDSVSVRLNSKFLKDALSYFDGDVYLEIRSEKEPLEMYGKSKEGVDLYVLIAPKVKETYDEESMPWKPYLGE